MSQGNSPTPVDANDGGKPPDGTNATCNSVALSPKPISLCGKGKTQEITATGTPAGGIYAFSSSDTSIATVAGVGNKATITAVAQGAVQITVEYTLSGAKCSGTAKVTVCTCTPKAGSRWYVHGSKAVNHLIGISAKIKTRYGKVCCEGCGTVDAYHVAYANITHLAPFRWAQTGYGRERNPGSKAVKTYRYAEMKGDTYKVNYDTGTAPAEGSVHSYACNLNKSTGKWSYLFDGVEWESFADNFWKGKTGTHANWMLEIFNKEDDMPGTAANKCAYTECQYCVDGKAYQNAGLAEGDMETDDASEWGVEHVSGTAFNVWDKKPLK